MLKLSENVVHHKKGTRVFSAKLNGKHVVAPTIDVFDQVGLKVKYDKMVPFEVRGWVVFRVSVFLSSVLFFFLRPFSYSYTHTSK